MFFLQLVHDLSAGPSGCAPAEIVGSNPTRGALQE